MVVHMQLQVLPLLGDLLGKREGLQVQLRILTGWGVVSRSIVHLPQSANLILYLPNLSLISQYLFLSRPHFLHLRTRLFLEHYLPTIPLNHLQRQRYFPQHLLIVHSAVALSPLLPRNSVGIDGLLTGQPPLSDEGGSSA
jgi:hypothetical protein